MKVLMTTDTIGGVCTYALELARALTPHRITLATMGNPPTAQQERDVYLAGNIDLRVSVFRLEWMENAWEDVRQAGAWLLRLEEQIKPDVVHLNGYSHGRCRGASSRLWWATRASFPGGGRCWGRIRRRPGNPTGERSQRASRGRRQSLLRHAPCWTCWASTTDRCPIPW